MTTFDGWETQYYGISPYSGQDVLAHFRTKGSKNGVRKYQNPDGSWTPLGLRERKEREGWGESRRERRAAKKVAKAEKRLAKQERRKEVLQKRLDKRKMHDVSALTDDELKKRIERVRMEQEYKELTRSPVLKAGEKAVHMVLDYRVNKAQAEASKEKAKLENNRITSEIVKARESSRRAAEEAKSAKAEAKKAKYDMKTKKWDVKGGLEDERKKDLIQAKIGWRNGTIHGGVQKRINQWLTAGKDKQYEKKRTAEGQVEAERILRSDRKTAAKAKQREARKEEKRRAKAAKKNEPPKKIQPRNKNFNKFLGDLDSDARRRLGL